jgi:hypothetical protein
MLTPEAQQMHSIMISAQIMAGMVTAFLIACFTATFENPCDSNSTSNGTVGNFVPQIPNTRPPSENGCLSPKVCCISRLDDISICYEDSNCCGTSGPIGVSVLTAFHVLGKVKLVDFMQRLKAGSYSGCKLPLNNSTAVLLPVLCSRI